MASSGKPTIWTRNFICVLITNCMLVLSHSSVNTLVSTYTTFLGAGPKLMGLLTGLFFGVALAMRPVAGPVTTRIDNRRLMLVVYVLGSFVNLGYALFHSIPAFIVFRVLNGFQYAFVGSLGITIAADSLPKEKMSSGLGIYGVSSAIATSMAPQIGIWLRSFGTAIGGEDMGFTFVFLFAACALAIGLIPSALLIPDHKDKAQLANVGKWYQTIISKPAIMPSLIMMLLIISYSLFSGYMVPYGEEIGVADVGIFFTVLSVVMLASRPVCGNLSDRYGAKKVFLPGALVFAVAFIAIGSATNLTLILVGAVLAALGYGAANPTLQSLTMQTETKARRAVASNTLFVGMDIGFFVGPLIGGFIKEYGTYRMILLFGTIPAVLAALLFIVTWRNSARRLAEVRAMEEAAA